MCWQKVVRTSETDCCFLISVVIGDKSSTCACSRLLKDSNLHDALCISQSYHDGDTRILHSLTMIITCTSW